MTSMGQLLNSLALIRTHLLETLSETLVVVLPGSAILVQLSVARKATCFPSSSVVPLAGVPVLLVLPRVPEVLISKLVSTSLLWMLVRAPSAL